VLAQVALSLQGIPIELQIHHHSTPKFTPNEVLFVATFNHHFSIVIRTCESFRTTCNRRIPQSP
jgi:hypothetical protein